MKQTNLFGQEFAPTVSEQTWLDCSTSWFLNINGVRTGGEIYSSIDAIAQVKTLAKQLKGEYVGLNESNELIDTIFKDIL